MSNFFNIDINRIATAAIGALVLSTACIGAAVAPARAVETDTALQLAQADAVPAGTQAAA
jgi:Pyruvate/2-oxoacid:ferredoxin oxidoreductase gamma subunit